MTPSMGHPATVYRVIKEIIGSFRKAEIMKRDDDLIRCLLLKMEESEYSDYVCALTIDSEQEEEREYFHLQLLSDAGYVLETGHHSGAFRLTNQGCDYLNTIRDSEIWSKTKVAAKGVGYCDRSYKGGIEGAAWP
jgi:hypothetical protein